MGAWVSFKRLREEVRFAQVLEALGIDATVRGDQASGFCPLPGHESRSQRRSKSFSVHLQRNIFQCFGCQAKGNVLDFWALMHGHDPADKAQLRTAALSLSERFLPAEAEADGEIEEGDAMTEAIREEKPVVVNAPLPFELRGLDPNHRYLRRRGLRPETIEHFGPGFCSRGLMAGRVVIPLHDQGGQLIGYAGRLIDDRKVTDDNPKYRLPGSREREGKVHEFHKSELLFNGHRIEGPVDDLIVVEGFFGAMWLWQAGYPHVVATMGASCTERQAALLTGLLRPSGHLWVMSDGDEAGAKHAASILSLVGVHRFVRWVRLDEGQQPEDYSDVALESMLGVPPQT